MRTITQSEISAAKLLVIRRRLLPWLRDRRPERATPRRAVGYSLHEAFSSLTVEG